ncbi:hypothetical protein BH11BAC3_BH11BAC3_45110 [soil metagenome]
MKKIIIGLYVLSTITFLMSCKKEGLATNPSTETKQKDDSKSFLKDIKSDNQAEYYISGEFDGHKVYCSSTLGEYYPSNDTIMNALYANDSIGLDNIHLIRENREMTAMIAIYFDKAKIYTRLFPYLLPHANLGQCEAAEIQFINMKKLGTTGQCSPTDDFTFLGQSNSNVKVQVTSFLDNIMEGTFEGSLTTKTGSTIILKNGQYRIKIKKVPIGGNG